MVTVFKISLMKRGNTLQCKVSSVGVRPEQVQNGQDYERAFAEAFERHRPFSRLDVVIDSPGGAIESACGLLSAIEALDVPVNVLIDGQCGSAAGLVAFSNTWPVDITPNSRVTVHMPTAAGYRNEGGAWTLIRKLATQSSIHLLAGTYAARTKRRKKVCREWMEQGRTFTAEEAVENDLCRYILRRFEWEAMLNADTGL